MPELPEVETVARRLRRGGDGEPPLVGARVVRARVLSPRVVVRGDRAALARALRSRRVEAVRRRGKYLLFDLDGGEPSVLCVHLRMTGDLHHVDASDPEPASTRFALETDRGTKLLFTDPRHLGEAWLARRGEEIAARLGPDPLEDAFTARALAEALRDRRTPIKAALLDQSVAAGVGNIYADEALFRAGIHPLAQAARLDDGAIERLAEAVRGVLVEAIERLGRGEDRLYATYRGDGPFSVYGRAGAGCVRCGAPVEAIRVAGRTTSYCPGCQPPPTTAPRAVTSARAARGTGSAAPARAARGRRSSRGRPTR